MFANTRAVTVSTLGLAFAGLVGTKALASDLRVGASPLLTVDQNRASIVEGVVGQWRDALVIAYGSGAPGREAALRSSLMQLRADRLLAASLAGTVEGLENMLAQSDAGLAPSPQQASVLQEALAPKSLGEINRDLVYTPVTPCRILDTRGGGVGTVQASTTRSFLAANPAGNFSTQGGAASNCAIQVKPAAVMVNVTVAQNASGPAFLVAWPYDQPRPHSSTVNWNSAGQQVANAVVVQLCQGLGCTYDFSLYASSDTEAILDVLGYFTAPAGVVGDISGITAGTGLTGTTASGEASLALAPGYRLPQGCANGQVAKSNGAGGWTCQNDSTGGSGTGTVTSITAGTGLTGGTITVSGTIGIANAGVGPAQLAPGSVDVSRLYTSSTDARYFKWGGNAFGATAVLGTTDNQPVDIRVNGARVMRLEPNAESPNVIGGHPNNTVAAGEAGQVVAGGGETGTCWQSGTGWIRSCANHAKRSYATVGGGASNHASEFESVVGGGRGNTASGVGSTVAGGVENSVYGAWATVAGGSLNTANGMYSTVPGGLYNAADGQYSFAAGYHARAHHDGAFVFADGQDVDFASDAANSFRVRATGGGVRFVVAIDADGSDATNCVLDSASGGWNCSSDRRLKTGLRRLEGKKILAKLASVPIFEWTPKAATGVRHVGPTAQDFRAAFGLGKSNLHIGQQDADGVALAAIQGLHQLMREKDRAHQREIEHLKGEVAALRETLREVANRR